MLFIGNGTSRRSRSLRQLCRHFSSELDHSVHIAPFVVVPGKYLYLRAINDHRGGRIDNRRVRLTSVVLGKQRPLLIRKNSTERCFGGLFEELIHLGNTRGPLHLEHTIGQRSVQKRPPDG